MKVFEDDFSQVKQHRMKVFEDEFITSIFCNPGYENIWSWLFKSMVRPHLEYGNVTWGPHYTRWPSNMVEKVQKRCNKINITSIWHLPYVQRLKIFEDYHH